jgi:hypothetical protein
MKVAGTVKDDRTPLVEPPVCVAEGIRRQVERAGHDITGALFGQTDIQQLPATRKQARGIRARQRFLAREAWQQIRVQERHGQFPRSPHFSSFWQSEWHTCDNSPTTTMTSAMSTATTAVTIQPSKCI